MPLASKRQILDFEDRCPSNYVRRIALRNWHYEDFSDHHACEFGFVGLGGAHRCDHAAAAQHRDFVCHRKRLAELVSYQHDDSALATKPPEQIQKRAQLGRREYAGRLVENQDLRIEAQCAEHFEPDSLRHRQILDGGIGRRQLEAEVCAQARARRPRPRRV